ncbi:MAG: hypothetical protein ACE5FM_04625 [Methyloligellaceae bacterium]
MGGIVKQAYGVVIDNLKRIKNPGFQKALLAVDRTLRPKKYAAEREKRAAQERVRRAKQKMKIPGKKVKRPMEDAEATPPDLEEFDIEPSDFEFDPEFDIEIEGRSIRGTVLGIVALQIRMRLPFLAALSTPVVRAYRRKEGGYVVPISDVADLALYRAKMAVSNETLSGGLRPHFAKMSLEEAEGMVEGLVQLNMVQYRAGEQNVIEGIRSKQIRYERRDPNEHWKSVKELWTSGSGDCEDLAASVAAWHRLQGDAGARVIVVKGAGRVAHAQVLRGSGAVEDPSVWAGMR